MNASNAAELLAKDNIDGGLIGGASLKAVSYTHLPYLSGEKTCLQSSISEQSFQTKQWNDI